VRSRSLAAAPVRNVRGFALAASAQPRNVREIDSDGAAPARKHTESAPATLTRRRRTTNIVADGAPPRRNDANRLLAPAPRAQNGAFPSPALARRSRSVAEPVHAPFPASRSALSRRKPPPTAAASLNGHASCKALPFFLLARRGRSSLRAQGHPLRNALLPKREGGSDRHHGLRSHPSLFAQKPMSFAM